MEDIEKARILAILEKFSKLGGDDDVVVFSKGEAEILRRVAGELDVDTLKNLVSTFESFRGAIKVGGWLGNFLKWFLIIAAGIAAFKAGLLDFLSIDGGAK